ncbi:MAG: nicotinate phosphoribosyltransferase [Candidatus Omnitrophota bacterium]
MGNSLALLADFYEFTMAEAYFNYRREALATFDLFVRDMPLNRAYLVFCGLKDILSYIRSVRFSNDDLGYLKRQGIFSADFLRYLKGLRFHGDIWAMPEGEVFFPGEPVIRVSASLIEAQIIESFLLSTVNLQTMIASKALRVVLAASGRRVYDFSLRRTHGAEAGVKVARAAYIAGFAGTANVLAGKIYGIPVSGTMAHSYVMSFKKELDSFLAYTSIFPRRSVLLVDTYDTIKGVANAIKIGRYLKEKGHPLLGIRLDSGDLVVLSRKARKMLDEGGLSDVKIFASGNLDEFKIEYLLDRGAKIDSFGVGTNMGVSVDAPYLDVVYKLSEVTDEEGNFLPAMKLSRGKITYPGRKQVYRIFDNKGMFSRDIIGLENEKIKGRPLLRRVIKEGRLVCKIPALERTRGYAKREIALLALRYKNIHTKDKYPVEISPGLKRLAQGFRRDIKKNQ